jgi:uncharacterized membrane protein
MPNPKKNMIKNALSLKGIEGLTDGVFAIVMTLLVLDLGVPILTGTLTHREFMPLLEMWPEFACYFVTFLMLGFVWSMHHRVFSVMKYTDSVSIWLNIICLMFASLLPFSTSFLAANLGQRLPILTYEGNFLFIALFGYLNWSYVTGKYRLVNKDIEAREVRQRKIQFMSGTVLSAIAMAIANVAKHKHRPGRGSSFFACPQKGENDESIQSIDKIPTTATTTAKTNAGQWCLYQRLLPDTDQRI